MAIEDGFDKVVSVEFNASTDGSIVDDEGVVSPEWRPLPGSKYRALPCRICDDQSQRAPAQEFSEDLTTATLLFSADCGLREDMTLRFGCVLPVSGKVAWYYGNGKITRPGQAYTRVRARLGAIL